MDILPLTLSRYTGDLMLERDAQRARAIQVGMLMRAYRESFLNRDGGRGLTQEELLRRMASVDSDYAQRYSHTTVSRWESGVTRPSRERLQVFGKALNLSRAEVAGLMSLAGFESGNPPHLGDLNSGPVATDHAASEVPLSEPGDPDMPRPVIQAEHKPGGNLASTVRQGFFSCLLPGLAIAGGAYLLQALGWNHTWMPIAYIVLAVAIRVAASFRGMNSQHDLCEFICVSLFVLLTTPLLQSAALGLDHYGFYSIGNLAGTPKPYMFALLVNLGLSTAAGALFYSLWNFRYKDSRRAGNPVSRAVSVVLPPMALVYVAVAFITNVAISIQLGVVFACLSAVLIIILLVRDPSVVAEERDRRFLLWSTLIVGLVLTTIGAATMLAIYLVPNIPAMLPEHNLLYSWTIDYDQMGYSPEEALRRFSVGYLWHASTILIYMVFVVGGKLFSSIYWWGSLRVTAPAVHPAAMDADGSLDPSPMPRRTGAFFGLGRSRDRETRSGSD